MSLPKDKAWFPAKTYGYGWGFPVKWQGWVVMLAYLVAMILGSIFLIRIHPGLYVVYVVAISVALGVICARTGERAAWRWGGVEEPASSEKEKNRRPPPTSSAPGGRGSA